MSRSKRQFVARLLLGGTVVVVCRQRSARAAPPDSTYRLVFADEFNGTSVDQSKWNIASPSWTMPNSLATASSSQVSESGGVLTLNATRPSSAASFSSGSISSYQKYTFTSGYVEARIKLPSTPGSWPAFWGLYTGWPPEADIMEYPLTTGSGGLANNQYNTAFHYSTGSGNASGAGVINAGSDLRNSFHTFGMKWVANTSVAFYLDGNQVSSFTNSAVNQMPYMYMIFDYAVGGWPGTPSTGQWGVGHSDQTQVDWVRVWQPNPAGDIASSWTAAANGSFNTSGNWSAGVPKFGNMTATFGTVGAGTVAVSTGAWQLFGGMTFSGTTAYTIGSLSNAIQLASTGTPVVNATSGSTVTQNINSKLELWSSTTFTNNMTAGGAAVLNLNGKIYGSGALTADGVGTTVLNAANTYTGGTNVGIGSGAAVLRVNANGALSTGGVTIGPAGNGTTARLEIAGSHTLANNITFSGRNNSTAGIESVNGSNTLSGTIAASAGGGTYAIQSDAGSTLTLSGADPNATATGVALQAGTTGTRTFTLQGAGNGVVSGIVRNGSGTLALTKADAGTWTLSGANTYTGATTVNGGTLVLSSSGATASIAIASGATLSTRGAITTSGPLTSAGTVDLVDTSVANLSAASLGLTSATLNFQLGNGTSSDRIVSTGAATVSGTNTVNVSAVPGQSISTGTTYTIITAASGLSAANFALGSKPASLNFTQFAFATPTAAQLQLSVSGQPTPATAYWTGAGSSATGDVNNNWGAGSSINTSNWSTDAAGTIDPQQLPGSISNVVLNSGNAAGVGGVVTTRLDSPYAINGLSFNVTAAGTTSTVLNTNGNTLSLGSGGMTLASGSNSAGTIGGAGSIVLGGSQSWANNSDSQSLTVSTGIAPSSGAATTLTFNGTGAGGIMLSGVLADGTGAPLSLVFNQAGTTTLAAVNTYTGTTTVSGGTVEISSTGRIVSDVTIASGGTLRINGNSNGIADANGVTVQAGGTFDIRAASGVPVSETIAMLNGAGTVTRGTSGTTTLTIGATDADSTFAGSIINGGGAMALVKTGAGTLTLAGPSSYSGGTTITDFGGDLLITNAGALGTGAITIGQGNSEPTATLQLDGDISVIGPSLINLSSRSTSDNGGAPTIENLSGNNTISANLNINNTGGNAANILSTAGTLTLTGNLFSTGLSSPRGFDFYGAGAGVVSGVIANGNVQPTFVQKDDDGTWTLSGNNTYTGGTTVNGGTLYLTGNNNFGGGAITVNDGTAVISGSNTFTGGTVISGNSTGGSTAAGGHVVVANPAALGADGATVTMSGNATLEIATDGGDRAYSLHVGSTNTVNLVSGVKTGATGINHTLGTMFIGVNDVVNVTAADYITGGSPSITLGAVSLSSGVGAGGTTFNPTTASLTLNSVSSTTNSAKTLVLDGTAVGNAVVGTISNGTNIVSVVKSNISTWTLTAANSYTGGTTIGGGILNVQNSAGLSTTGTVTLTSRAAGLQLQGNISIPAGVTFTLSNDGTGAVPYTVDNVSGNNAISGTMTMTAGGGSPVIQSDSGALTLGNVTSDQARTLTLQGASAAANTVSGVISNGTSGTNGVIKNGTGSWTLAGANTYTGSTAVNGGALTIAGSMASTGYAVAAGATLNVNGAIPVSSTISTSGTTTFAGNSGSTASIRSFGSLAINAGGQAQINASSFPFTPVVLRPGGVTFGSGGALDLTNNELIAGGSAASALTLIQAGQIFSSQPANANFAIGYADLGGADAGKYEVRYTLKGDADLSGAVDVGDLGALASRYGISGGMSWANGDFNQDGNVDVGDLGALATNYGAQLVAGSTLEGAASPVALIADSGPAVPEPASVGVLGIGALGLLGRRRRPRNRMHNA